VEAALLRVVLRGVVVVAWGRIGGRVVAGSRGGRGRDVPLRGFGVEVDEEPFFVLV